MRLEWLIEGLVMLPEERRAGLYEVAHGLLGSEGEYSVKNGLFPF